jgi:hypothetical protein
MTRKQETKLQSEGQPFIEIAPALLKIDHYIETQLRIPSGKYKECQQSLGTMLK